MNDQDQSVQETLSEDAQGLEPVNAVPAIKPWQQPQLKILDARQTMAGNNFNPDGPGYS